MNRGRSVDVPDRRDRETPDVADLSSNPHHPATTEMTPEQAKRILAMADELRAMALSLKSTASGSHLPTRKAVERVSKRLNAVRADLGALRDESAAVYKAAAAERLAAPHLGPYGRREGEAVA
jgi:hypothetical protein